MLKCVLRNFVDADVANNADFWYIKESNGFNVKLKKPPLIQNL